MPKKPDPLIKSKPSTIHTIGMIKLKLENGRPFDVQPSLNGRTTSKSHKTRADVFITKRTTSRLKERLKLCTNMVRIHQKKDPSTYTQSNRRSIDEARRPPRSPRPWGSAMGGQSMTDSHWQNVRGSASRPPGQGTPCWVPSSPRSATL